MAKGIYRDSTAPFIAHDEWGQIDAIDSLVFSIHANPGIYALAVGSGISRSAKIPTGWDITRELVRKLGKR
jgi:hypothetical protein